jgi:AsmA protein
MKRMLKTIALAVVAIVLVVVIAAVGLALFFDPNDYKDRITALASAKIGRELRIEGDLELAFFPWLGVRVGMVEMANAPGFGDAPFARVTGLQVRVKVLPLLQRRLVMDTVVVEGLDLDLARDATGRSNWDDLVTQQAAAPAVATAPAPAAEGPPPIAALALGGLDVRDARVVWQDGAAGTRYVVSHLDLRTGALRLEAPVRVDLACELHSDTPALTGQVKVGGAIAADLEQQRIAVQDLRLDTTMDGAIVPGGRATAALAAAIGVDLGHDSVQVTGLSLALETQPAAGSLSGKVIASGGADVDLAASQVATHGLRFEVQPGEGNPLGPGTNLTVAGDVLADLGHQTIRVSDLAVVTTYGPTSGTIGGRAVVKGGLEVDLVAQRLRIDPARLTAEVHGASLPVDRLDLNGTTAIALDLQEMVARIADLAIEVHAEPRTGEGGGMGGDATLAGSADLDLAGPRLHSQRLRVTAEMRGAAVPTGKLAATLATPVTADLGAETIALDDLRLHVLGLAVTADLQVSKLLSAPAASGKARIAAFNPRDLLQALGQAVPETRDSKALTRAALRTRFSGSADGVELNDIALTVDDSRLTGSVAVHDLATPAVRCELDLDTVDADRYLPPPSAAGTPPPAATPGAVAGAATELPLDTLRALDADATLRVGRLKAANMKVRNLRLTLAAHGGELRVHPAKARLYGGTYDGDVALDVRGPVPVVRLDESFSEVNAGPLLRDAVGQDRLSGKATVHAKVTARGSGADDLTRTLTGTAEVRITDGAVKGINIGRVLREARTTLNLAKGQAVAPVREVEQTDFSELRGTARIENGRVKNDDLAAKSPLLRVTGAGEVDLVREEVDYLLTATVVATRTGQGGKELADLAGIPIPVRITGPFAQLSYRPDLRALVKQRAEGEVKQRLEKEVDKRLKEQVPEELRDTLKEGLKGLLSR